MQEREKEKEEVRDRLGKAESVCRQCNAAMEAFMRRIGAEPDSVTLRAGNTRGMPTRSVLGSLSVNVKCLRLLLAHDSNSTRLGPALTGVAVCQF